MVDDEIFDAVHSVFQVVPPDGGAVVKRVNVHVLASGGGSKDAALVRLTNLDPLNESASVIALPQRRFIGIPNIARKFEGTVVAVLRRIKSKSEKPGHHTLVGFRRVAGDGQ